MNPPFQIREFPPGADVAPRNPDLARFYTSIREWYRWSALLIQAHLQDDPAYQSAATTLDSFGAVLAMLTERLRRDALAEEADMRARMLEDARDEAHREHVRADEGPGPQAGPYGPF